MRGTCSEVPLRVLFLDFDGVICTRDSIYSAHKYMKELDISGDRNLYSIKMIDPNLVENLNDVVEKTGAKVVISSSWRYGHSIEELRDYLIQTGFKGEVLGMTLRWNEYKNLIGIKTMKELEGFWNYERGNEIKMWIETHELESFVIIDDEISDIFPVFPNNYIHTNMELGFHDGLIDDAIEILMKIK